jgi:ankyrin repeat protein
MFRFVELLLSRGAQVDVRNKKGNSSLWLAANGGHLDVVQLLYSAGQQKSLNEKFSFSLFGLLGAKCLACNRNINLIILFMCMFSGR